MANSTGIAVGCAVGIPCFIAFCVAFVFWVKTRRRFQQEDLEFSKNQGVNEMDRDLSYNNIEQLKLEKDEGNFNTNSEPSEDSDQSRHQNQQLDDEDEKKSSNQLSRDDSKKQRYIPAYRKKLKSSITNLNNSRNSSFTNLQNGNSGQIHGSSSSINSSTTNHTNTDYFYNNIPVMQDQQNGSSKQLADSSNNSLDLARSLQQPTPSYSKKPAFNRSASISTNNDVETEDDYDLKNNYKVENEHEIQEEDQYENEFTNYSENKRAYINSLRPK